MIETSYNYFFVALSIVMAILASYVALDVGERVSLRKTWLIVAAITLGGGIWSMHFIAMLAYQMPMPVTYDVSTTLYSLFIAIAAAGVGFFLARHYLIAGGVVMGCGIAAMHYTGMAAMRMGATTHYNPYIVGLSVVIAIGAATSALKLFAEKVSRRILASVVMGGAISGMHYTGMAATTYTGGMPLVAPVGMTSFDLAMWVGCATISILGITLSASVLRGS